MALLDHLGRPIKQADLKQEHAQGGTTGVRQAWPESVASGLTPQKLAGILKDCDAGDIEGFMILAEEIEERDPHFSSVMGQRKRAVSGIEPTITAASEDKRDEEIAAWVKEHIAEHDGFSDLVEDLMDAVGKGFSVVEIDWRMDGNNWSPGEFIWRPQQFFQPDKETGREVRLRDDSDRQNGLELKAFKFLTHKAKLKSGSWFRGGISRIVLFSWLCKAYTIKDWMAFVETYGLPLRLGRYGTEASKEDVNTLFRAVANIGTDAAAVIPKFMDIEFVQNTSGGGSQPIFENLARYVDEQISKAVLGQTMTTDNGSSQAQANVHNEVRHDVAAADARSINGTINRDLIGPAVALNFGEGVKPPTLKIVVAEPEDVEMKVNGIVALSGAGVAFKASEARAILRMSDPEDGDEVFGGVVKKPDGSQVPGTMETASATPPPTGDLVDDIVRDMMGDWEPVADELLAPFVKAIETASSYEEAKAKLAAIEGFPVSKLIDQLVKGTFAARAGGDVTDE